MEQNFEEKLREKIKASGFGTDARTSLKTILGEIEQKKVGKPLADEICYGIVKKTIQSNNETLGYMTEGDSRRAAYLVENELLAELLPDYWTAEQIKAALSVADIQAAKSDGMAIGIATKTLKSLNASVENETVRNVVVEMRKLST